jgi:protein-disulfide isomerase
MERQMKRMIVTPALAALLLATLACAHEEGKPAPPAPAPVPPGAVAVVDGQPITEQELDKALGNRLVTLRQQEYQIKSDALKELIFQRLESQDAAKAGLSVEAFHKANVAEKVAEPTEDEVKEVMDRYRGQLPKDDADARQKVVTFLKQQKEQQREAAFREELLGQANVHILLQPPRAEVTIGADDPTRGPADAPVTIVEFSDFQCPYCARIEPVLAQVRKKYGDKIRWVFKQLPLPMHPNARRAAEASLCAADQGKFWELHDWMFAHQDELTEESLKTEAKALGMDADKFGACLDGKTKSKQVVADMGEAQRVGVNGTPGFLVNGRLLVGAQPLNAFTDIIDDELARAGKTQATTATK